jgi:hypothetical protein
MKVKSKSIIDEETVMAEGDEEAAAAAAAIRSNNDKHMNRSISFQDDHLAPSEVRRRRCKSKRAASISSSPDTSEEDDDDDVLNDTDTHDSCENNESDDSLSLALTETSGISEDEEGKDGNRWSMKRRFPHAYMHRRRERKRKRREEENDRNEQDDENVHTYRRTPVLTGVIAPFSIMLEVRAER